MVNLEFSSEIAQDRTTHSNDHEQIYIGGSYSTFQADHLEINAR